MTDQMTTYCHCLTKFISDQKPGPVSLEIASLRRKEKTWKHLKEEKGGSKRSKNSKTSEFVQRCFVVSTCVTQSHERTRYQKANKLQPLNLCKS